MDETTPLAVAASYIDKAFTPKYVLYSLEYLADPGHAEEAIRVVRATRPTHPAKNAKLFWSDLITVILSTGSAAVFCDETHVSSKLSWRARTALTAEYSKLFRHAGFEHDSHVPIYDLLRSAHSQQIIPEHITRLQRDVALGAVLKTSTPDTRQWITLLETLLQAQWRCRPPLKIDEQVVKIMARLVRQHHSHFAQLDIWTSPSTDIQDVIDWLRTI